MPAKKQVDHSPTISMRMLPGSTAKALPLVRVFDEKTKKVAYNNQTTGAKAKGKSNCPQCAAGPAANKAKIHDLKEMDADHVAA